MTESETILLIGKIKTMYIKEFNNIDDETLDMMIETWADCLSDLPLDECMNALKRHAASSKWSPTMSDIRDQISKMFDDDLSAVDSWEKCKKIAIELPMYGSSWDLNNFDLHDIEKRCLISVGIEDIKNADIRTMGVIRGQFIRFFNELNEKRLVENKMPHSLKRTSVQAIKKSEQKSLIKSNNTTKDEILSIGGIIEEQKKGTYAYQEGWASCYPEGFFDGIKHPLDKMAKALGVIRKG